MVDARPVGAVLDDEGGVRSDFVDFGAGYAGVRAAVFELEVGYFERVLVVGVLDEAAC